MKRSRQAAPKPIPAPRTSFVPRELVGLAGLTLLAALLRLVALDRVPPGLNQDEALSAWNAWCLLHTGRALSGESWPIFHCRNLGDHPTMLFFYLLLPFQKLGGLNVWTTRLPVALAGTVTVPLVAWVGARLGRPVAGLIAAAMFAVAPWMVFIGRFGVGAGLTPLQAILPVAALLLAGVPIADGPRREPRAGWAFAAGFLAGLSGYGFHSMRIYMPLVLFALPLLSPGELRAMAAERRGRTALIALAAGFLVTYGPLAYQSIVDPGMTQRWQMTRLWEPGASLATIVGLIAQRYVDHFGPEFLFVHGDHFSPFRPLGGGELGWYVLPGLLTGAVAALLAARRSRSARTLLALVLLYPTGDLVSRNDGPHLLRSAAGAWALLMLAAWGTVELVRAARARRAALGTAVAVVLALAAVGQEAVQTKRYFVDFPKVWKNQIDYQAALLDAARWIRPRLAGHEAVFCTTTGMTQPFAVMLVGLQYDPAQWFRDAKDIRPGEFDDYVRIGPLYFNDQGAAQSYFAAFTADGRDERVFFVVRPHEFGLTDPVKRIVGTTGEEMLWICERTI